MATWDELKIVLARLTDQDPGPLIAGPDPRVDEGRRPPFAILLEPWAADVAAELHQRFGDGVELTVGLLGTPGAT